MTLIFLPLTPPWALISSMAIMMPLCVDVPNVACGPVSEPYSPTRISPPPAVVLEAVPVSDFGAQPANTSVAAATITIQSCLCIVSSPRARRILQQAVHGRCHGRPNCDGSAIAVPSGVTLVWRGLVVRALGGGRGRG